METLLATLGTFGTALVFFALLALTIIGFRRVLVHRPVAVPQPDSPLLKKYPDVDANTYHGLIAKISLALSLAIVLSVMEFPSRPNDSLVVLTSENRDLLDEMQDVPITEQPPPPPPDLREIRGAEIIVVQDNELIEEEIKVIFDTEFAEDLAIAAPMPGAPVEIATEEEEEEATDEIYTIVEEPAMPQGGYETFYAFVQQELHYPARALHARIQGKVFVGFVIDKNGKITDVKAVRGIGGGCDEEAVRVVQQAPAWIPARQRGMKVRQHIVLPIHFKLAD